MTWEEALKKRIVPDDVNGALKLFLMEINGSEDDVDVRNGWYLG